LAFFNGKGPNQRAYKRGASLRFEKGVGAKYLELKIDDRQKKLQRSSRSRTGNSP